MPVKDDEYVKLKVDSEEEEGFQLVSQLSLGGRENEQ